MIYPEWLQGARQSAAFLVGYAQGLKPGPNALTRFLWLRSRAYRAGFHQARMISAVEAAQRQRARSASSGIPGSSTGG